MSDPNEKRSRPCASLLDEPEEEFRERDQAISERPGREKEPGDTNLEKHDGGIPSVLGEVSVEVVCAPGAPANEAPIAPRVTEPEATPAHDPVPPPEPDQTLIREPRCTMCNLPSDLLESAKAMRFDQDLSSAKIAVKLNPLLERRKIPKRVGVRGVSHHFAEHGTAAERLQYRCKAFGSGGRELNLSGPPEKVLAILSDARTRRLQEVADFLVESQAERLDSELLRFETTGLSVGSDYHSRAVSVLNQTSKALAAAVDLSRRLANGPQAEAMATSVVFDSFVDHVASLVGAALEAGGAAALAEVPLEKQAAVRTRLHEVVSELADAMRKLVRDFETKLADAKRQAD